MAFKFGLDSVLKYRKRLEDVAQRAFVDAQKAVDEVLQRLEGMYARLDEVREEILRTQQSGSKGNLELVREMELFVSGQKIRIASTRQEARDLLQKAEEQQELLIAAAREKKILVKLKEKRLTEYKTWLDHIEAKNQDDQTMMRQGWGKR